MLRVDLDGVVFVWTAYELVCYDDFKLRNVTSSESIHQDGEVELLQVILVIKPCVSVSIVDFKLLDWVADTLSVAYLSCSATSWNDLAGIGVSNEIHVTCHILISCEEIFLGLLVIVFDVVPLVRIAFTLSVMSNRVIREAISTNQFANGHHKETIRGLLGSHINTERHLCNQFIRPASVILVPGAGVVGDAPRIPNE